MDIFLTRSVSPNWFTAAVSRQLPRGIEVVDVYPIAPGLPSLQSQVRSAEYEVEVATDRKSQEIEAAISRLLSLEHLPWHHERDTGRRNYNLRPLIDDLWLIDRCNSYCTLGMRLRCDNSGAGRPEQVALALGFSDYPNSIRRTRLYLQAKV
jgi:radical SAM-linked protein